jgi:K+-sensing histidine kinase KdpD
MQYWREYAIGAGICAFAAALGAIALHGSVLKAFLPFLFLAVVILVSLRFGSVAGFFGTVCAALIFAAFLFDPIFSMKVNDSVERSNLIWMIFGRICASELIGFKPEKAAIHKRMPRP